MNRLGWGLAAVALLLLAPNARADSPISSVIELKLGGYAPQVDSETGVQKAIAAGKPAPYASAFGDKHILLFQLEYDYEFFQAFGSVSGAISAGYGEVYGKGLFASTGQASSDSTSLKVWPVKLLGVYRFDVPFRRWDVPLVPFVKFGLVCEFWRTSNGSGDVAISDDSKGEGANFGWEADLGLALALDWLDPDLGKDMDIDLGINHAYFFGEWSDMSPIRKNPFSAPDRMRLNDKFFNFGLALEF